MQNEVNRQVAPLEWACRHCTHVFDTRGKRNAHQRRKHQITSTMVIIPGVKQTLKRSHNGMFICSCTKNYYSAQSLKRHQKTCDLAAEILDVEIVEG